ncbi:uncharacterized protein LOC116019324 isoform X2 [Ipomoea triloba]|uniref:uncharacterized protein LOC116019324 isoform X2 n=1 Tax=Ipomoea triloba TaxID=35885 RepID=UPI00125D780F|nr:uncharacterized protein LOC116019324 isoform X2 [Ipomoea triloba]
MANPGGIGTKFVSVNLNKSYGQPHHHSHQSSSGSYGQAGAGRGRPGSGGGGGMVVLSRPRSSQKTGPKLSVPPPMNLPSLRKEHQRFDVSGSGSGTASGGRPGSGTRPSSSGMGWTKPAPGIGLQGKDGTGDAQVVEEMDQTGHGVEGLNQENGAYMPPSARSSGIGALVPSSTKAFPTLAEKASVLRGEDFPSLQAALPVSSAPAQKQKDSSSQKQKLGEEYSNQARDNFGSLDMRPHGHSSRQSIENGPVESGSEGHDLGRSSLADQPWKQEEYFAGPLPIVRLNPRSDWADDERDTGHGFVDRGRDSRMAKGENYWDSDFDMPRTSVLPHKPVNNQYERWAQRDTETGPVVSSEVRGDAYRRDMRTASREGNMWKSSPLPRDGNAVEAVNNRNTVNSRTSVLNKDIGKDSRYVPPQFGETARDVGVTGNRESTFGRKETVHASEGQQYMNNARESFNSRGSERMTRDRYGSEQSNRFGVQNSSGPKPSFASSGKSLTITDPVPNLGREKRAFLRNEKPYVEDLFTKDFVSAGFDERDLFSGGFVGVIKRKKDVVKQTDFHDPVRESFEAELERVQKMQELERQRVIEEQERALEQAQREEEERQRLIREEEERRRRLEEEAREAAWRAEQERLEAIRRADEQRNAREEERRRMFLEEERRKQAAKQKLLELEAKIAKRQATTEKTEVSVVLEEKLPANVKENETADLDNWDESERMVERLTTSTYSEAPVLSRSSEIGSRSYPPRESFPNFGDTGKSINSWRRDVFGNGSGSRVQPQEHDFGHYSPRRDATAGVRGAPRKEFNGGSGYMSSRSFMKEGMQETCMDEFGHPKEDRWNLSVDADSYNRGREIDSEFQDNFAEKYNDIGWRQGHSRGNTRFPYPGRSYQNSETDEHFSYSKSRYSMRQPRVLPPPTLSTMQRNSLRGANEHAGTSDYVGSENTQSTGSGSTQQTVYYGGHQESSGASLAVDLQQENTAREEKKLRKDMGPRCDSQSSLSVTSPPNSPPHLSNDELDESGDSPVVSTPAGGQKISLSGNKCHALNDDSVKDATRTASSSISAVEDEEWTTENNDDLPLQEEYDEEEDGYREEDELREGDDTIDLTQEFEDMQLGERVPSPNSHNLVLGFNEGVEVAMPSDDFERNLRNEESIFDRPDTYVRIPEEQGPISGVQVDESCYQPAEGSSQSSSRSSSGRIAETEKSMQEAVMKPANVPHTSATSNLLDVDAPSTSSVSAQQSLSPVHKPLSASQTVLPTASSTPSQADLPVKLQFGLFSGPSLIPSPVPAIQIGSIQMPLHLHPPVGTSLAHIHPSQPSIFQFGQFRYSPPISQGILPGTALPMPFIQPSLHSNYNVNQGTVGSLLTPHAEDVCSGKMADGSSLSINKPTGFVTGSPVQSHRNVPELGSTLVRATENNAQTHKINSEASGATDSKLPEEVGFQCEDKEQGNADLQSSKEQNVQPPLRIFSGERSSGGFKAQGSFSGNRGRRFTYAVKNNTARSSFTASETSFSESSGFQRRPRRIVQRTEFRIRENTDRRQLSGSLSANDSGLDDKLNYNGRAGGGFQRSGSKRGSMSNKSIKHTVEAENSKSANNGSQNMDSENKARKDSGKDPVMKNQGLSSYNEGNLKRNISEEDVDAPLQSGVVRVFKQPGIEAPSDEDDFIEVRSKRQMLNDRREQREKEIKAKSRVLKPPRKPRTSRQNIAVSTSLNKVSAPVGGEIPEKTQSDFVATEGHGSANKDESMGYTTSGLQPLAPIGTPAINTGAQADIRSNKSLHTPTATVVSGDGSDGVNMMFEGNKNGDAVMASSSSWGAPRVNQQSQLEEAMKPVRFDAHVSSVGSHSSSVSGPSLPSSKILANDKSFASTASPINSLLAGEKIQFGAVTSPTILPASSRVVSHGIGAPGSNRSDAQISHNLSATKNDCSLLFDKLPNDSSVNLQDSEAEAEAAASAVAVAAITNDELVENGLGSATASETKIYEGDRQLGSQSRVEEPLNVSLPADLSVENPPIPLWPRLPDPQNSSGQMLSHFPGGPPSHFPFYEMNPVLGGPIFSFGPHEEPVASQSQSQKSTSSGSGPLGTWQQCHSSMDSFYGPPTGFTGPFISPPGQIPGVQGPPHMVVYNHFAPVRQFGQVGLSFMGSTTYITSGKHNPTTSAMGINEGDMNNMNIASTQRNTSNVPAPVQHLAPGSPLIPMASPVAMFDVSPFQPSPDMSVQARWSSLPSSLHSAPLSQPLQQAETIPPAAFGHGQPVDQSLNVSRFTEALSSTASDGCPKFTMSTNTPAQFPDELGLVDSSRSATGPSSDSGVSQGFPGTATDAGKNDTLQNDISNNIRDQATSGFKAQLPRQKNVSAAHQSHPTGYTYQRGSGMSQRNAAGNEWSHRRTGFHGRNQSFGADKGFSSTKVKQIYVAKQSTSGTKTEG